MIRSLAPDELEWFIASSYAFLEHSEPRSFARRAVGLLRDPELEADRSFVLFDDGMPVAGMYVLAPAPDEDDQNLYLSNVWFSRSVEDLKTLTQWVLRKNPHEAVHYPLHNVSPERQQELVAMFEEWGFSLAKACDLEFKLADLPPLGLPLVLEAWLDEADPLFKEVYTKAEGYEPSDQQWAYFKRWRGRFVPDLWFIARETLDQYPVGYAFFGAHRTGVDGEYYLTAAGVLTEYRDSSEMLKRLVLSGMHELAARSPFGSIRTTLLERDPKLIRIFEMLGFYSVGRYPVLHKVPS